MIDALHFVGMGVLSIATSDNDSGPVQVAGLATCVDLDQDSRGVSVSARQDAVLTTGHRVLLVDHRGWCDSGVATWADLCPQDIADTARTVVGPFLPSDGHPHPDLEAEHWTSLAATLAQHGIQVNAQDMPHLPHDVVLSPRLQWQVGCHIARHATT